MHLLKVAVEEGRLLQKEQTGLIHYCSQSKDLITHDAIPLLENGLMALALLRNRHVDDFLEGKQWIERLIPFEVEGSFPVYLHEFPNLQDPYRGLRMAPIFFWILQDVGHLLKELKEKLQAILMRIVEKGKSLQDPPLWVQLRLCALQGQKVSSSLLSSDSEDLISLQIAEAKGVLVEEQIIHLCKKWHSLLALYVGEASSRPQEGFFPKVTPFDLFMGQWCSHFSARLKTPHPVHLYGALVRPLAESLEKRTDLFAPLQVPYVHVKPEEDLPFWIGWGEDRLFCFAKQKTTLEHRSGKRELSQLEELLITLPSSSEETGGGRELDDLHEVTFFLNYEPRTEIYVEGKKGTTFELGEEVTLVSSEGVISLRYFVEEGKGRFLGHISRGNRPHQLWTKGERRFFAFDWKISLRTIERDPHVTIRVEVHLQKLQNPEPLPLHASDCPRIE